MLQHTLRDDLTSAMKAQEEPARTVLRGILSALTNELVSLGRTPRDELSDEEVLAVLKRLSNQRKDSIEQYSKAGRDDLVQVEKAELSVIEHYLPEMMQKEEIRDIALAKKAELQIEDRTKMGLLMGAIMKDLKGKADGGDVKVVVEELFL